MELHSDRIVVALALTAFLVAFEVFAIRELVRILRPSFAIRDGRYADARSAAEVLMKSLTGRLSLRVRQTALYNHACALHLEGRLDESVAALVPLRAERLSPVLVHAAASLEASSLTLSNGDPERIEALIGILRETRMPLSAEDLLIIALVLFEKHRELSEQLFAKIPETPRQRGLRLGRTIMLPAKPGQVATFHVLRAMWLERAGRVTDARAAFERAAHAPNVNVYVEIARSRLGMRSAEPEASSLSPQVVSSVEREGR